MEWFVLDVLPVHTVKFPLKVGQRLYLSLTEGLNEAQRQALGGYFSQALALSGFHTQPLKLLFGKSLFHLFQNTANLFVSHLIHPDRCIGLLRSDRVGRHKFPIYIIFSLKILPMNDP